MRGKSIGKEQETEPVAENVSKSATFVIQVKILKGQSTTYAIYMSNSRDVRGTVKK